MSLSKEQSQWFIAHCANVWAYGPSLPDFVMQAAADTLTAQLMAWWWHETRERAVVCTGGSHCSRNSSETYQAPPVPVSVLDESLWGVQGEQVWAVYHPVTRTKLGEKSRNLGTLLEEKKGRVRHLKQSLQWKPSQGTLLWKTVLHEFLQAMLDAGVGKLNSPKVNFLSYYKLTLGVAIATAERPAGCVNTPSRFPSHWA
ncbi:uncharacterized protein FYW23_001155 [Sylvia borin]